MEIRPFKSAENFFKEKIQSLEYKDLMPSINTINLKAKFEKILSSDDSPYWEILKIDKNWEKWLFLNMRTFKEWDSTCIGIVFGKRELIVNVFQELSGGKFHNKHMEHEIDLIESWLNHEYMFTQLWKIIEATLRYSNRPSKDDKFVNPFK